MSNLQIVKTGVINLVDIGTTISISTLLERTFPTLDESKPVWMTGLEVWGQVFSSVVLATELRALMSGVYLDDPTGGMAFSPLLFLLQPKLIQKVSYLKDQASGYVGSMFIQTQ